jgi:hypothetical protein
MSNLKRQSEREPKSTKANVDIKDAWIDTSMGSDHNFLWGVPVNHPAASINGKLVHTSFIVKVEGSIVETKHNVYNILSWNESQVHPQGELF